MDDPGEDEGPEGKGQRGGGADGGRDDVPGQQGRTFHLATSAPDGAPFLLFVGLKLAGLALRTWGRSARG